MQQTDKTSVLNSTKPVNSPYQLVMFDFDGTLCNTEAADIQALQKSYHQLQQPMPSIAKMHETLGKGVIAQDIFTTLSPDLPGHLTTQLLEAYQTIYPAEAQNAKLFEGVVPLLQQLQQAQYQMIVVSNKNLSLLQSAVTALDIKKYFQGVFGVENSNLYKPDPLLYTSVIAPHFSSIERGSLLMVGDTQTDLLFANHLGIDACWARYGNGEDTTCNPLNPKHTIERIQDLQSILLSNEAMTQ